MYWTVQASLSSFYMPAVSSPVVRLPRGAGSVKLVTGKPKCVCV